MSAVLAVLGSFPIQVQAHPADDFFNRMWGVNNRIVPWHFTESFPGTNSDNFRMRVRDGATEWNNVTNVEV
jgi:hypothetical protein